MDSNQPRSYIAIDLKSFFASVECVERGLNPLTTNLVVADESRTEKTICLAVSPSLKAYGIAGRARLFEVVQRVKEINRQRWYRTWSHRFTGKSSDDPQLKAHPDWELDYIVAPPQMAKYIAYSKRVYSVYLKYVAAEDIHVYSIDEVFMDVTQYLKTYKATPHQLAMMMIRDVLATTGITATAGIGTNLYLAKVAMDIVAKHVDADSDGVRIAELDEMSYRQQLWSHQPLTSFWRVGHGIAARLAQLGLYTMGDVARQSVVNEEVLYRAFGVNAELLIDHAWGWEPCTIDRIKAYRPERNSLSSGQVLHCPYDFRKARVVIHEMAEAAALDLVDKQLVTDQVAIYVGYDRESLTGDVSKANYEGAVAIDHYGRMVPKPVHGSVRLGRPTNSAMIISQAVLQLFDRLVDAHLLVRRLNVVTDHVVPVGVAREAQRRQPIQLDLFEDYEARQREEQEREALMQREAKMQQTALAIKQRFGKNALLKGLNFEEGATAIDRNKQIGGHKA